MPDMPFEFNHSLRDQIENELAAFDRRRAGSADLIRAAVAIVLVSSQQGADACVVLTRRPKNLRRHSGQFALPGGRVDAGEELSDAVLRETREEIGIDAGKADILGWLDDFVTRSGFCVSPAVIWAGGVRNIQPDPEEVAVVFRIPLWDLNRPEIPGMRNREGSELPVFCVPLETIGQEVYAPTAAILYQFREIALNGRATRVAHFEQPRFAWK